MFIITAVVYAVGALGFILLGRGETQKWAVSNKQALQIIVRQEEKIVGKQIIVRQEEKIVGKEIIVRQEEKDS